MTQTMLRNNTTLQSAGTEPGSSDWLSKPNGLLQTEPTAKFQLQPATRQTHVITWEPVILPLLERLAELRWLPEEERWPGADWPLEEAFQDAGKFTERLPATMRVAPHISLADDGEVNFAWSQGGIWIDLGFYGSGTYSFYARGKNGEEWFGDEIPVASSLPRELRALLAG